MTEREVRIINGKEVALYRHKELDSYLFAEDVVDLLLKAFEEVEQYRAIGTVEELQNMKDHLLMVKGMCKDYYEIGTIEEFKALKEKAEPKEMDRYYCPICRHYFEDTDAYNYCPVCGQKMKSILE